MKLITIKITSKIKNARVSLRGLDLGLSLPLKLLPKQ